MTTIHAGDCSTDCAICKANCSCGSCGVFGYHVEGEGIICVKCGDNPMYNYVLTEAEAIGYPDGYTCLDCGDTVGSEHYEGE